MTLFSVLLKQERLLRVLAEKSKSKAKQKNSPLEISPARLPIKYKFLRKQWRKFTDRVKMGSRKAPIEEPEWFTILNPIFSHTMGDMDAASSPSDVGLGLEEEGDNDRPNTTNTRTEPRKVVIQLMKSVVRPAAVLVEPKGSKRSPSLR